MNNRDDLFLNVGAVFLNVLFAFITFDNINVVVAIGSGLLVCVKNLPYVLVRSWELWLFFSHPKERGYIVHHWRNEIKELKAAAKEGVNETIRKLSIVQKTKDKTNENDN